MEISKEILGAKKTVNKSLFGDSLLIFFFEKQKKTHDTRKFVMYANIVTITIN
jgi:hypothetical protein